MTPADTMRAAVEALEYMLTEKADYMVRNKLGDPERETATKLARSALSLLRSALEQLACARCNGTRQIRRVGSTPMGRPIMEVDVCPSCSELASIPPNTPVEAGKVGVADGPCLSLDGEARHCVLWKCHEAKACAHGVTAVDACPATEEWNQASRIRDLPEVDEAIRNMLEDQTGDNSTCMVREVLRAARGVKGPDQC